MARGWIIEVIVTRSRVIAVLFKIAPIVKDHACYDYILSVCPGKFGGTSIYSYIMNENQ